MKTARRRKSEEKLCGENRRGERGGDTRVIRGREVFDYVNCLTTKQFQFPDNC